MRFLGALLVELFLVLLLGVSLLCLLTAYFFPLGLLALLLSQERLLTQAQ